MESYAKSFKVVLLGEGAVGKTSLMLRYTENKFVNDHISTVQAAFANKHLIVDNERVELAIWDTAGQERFHALGPIYYRDSHGALLVYDITDRHSFDRVKKWVEELLQMLGDSVTLFVVGNKVDLEASRVISRDEAMSYASSINTQFFECSAKTNECVDEIFDAIATAILKKAREQSVVFDEQEAQSTNILRRHSGSRRSIRIVEETEEVRERRRKCC
ncbi:hypothetical protein Mgra_00001441 [Meloidogyne graminicola]|uniref:Ras-related protein Rab-21 n=1 Tax=Meloidogyne graminicola TaxID=189291 RepID=A0A8S9ZZS2_9BILA|nr:hypothetical protein Mgra_00001441 [Meloidogyne graminicola]